MQIVTIYMNARTRHFPEGRGRGAGGVGWIHVSNPCDHKKKYKFFFEPIEHAQWVLECIRCRRQWKQWTS